MPRSHSLWFKDVSATVSADEGLLLCWKHVWALSILRVSCSSSAGTGVRDGSCNRRLSSWRFTTFRATHTLFYLSVERREKRTGIFMIVNFLLPSLPHYTSLVWLLYTKEALR